MSASRPAPVRYLLLLTCCWLVVFSLTRSILLFSHLTEAGSGSVLSYLVGFAYDVAFISYAMLPLGLYLLVCPARLWRWRPHRWLLRSVFAFSVFVMLFVAVAEWLFWDEFGVRFNFIAVDYLVYSDEVLNNILESYPVGTLLSVLAVLAMAISLLLRRPLAEAMGAPIGEARLRMVWFVLLCVVAGLSALLADQQWPRGQNGNAYQRELSSNGPYQFFAAFRNNELDYEQFYSTVDAQRAGTLIRSELAETPDIFAGDDPEDIRRKVTGTRALRTPNIVLVTIESLSAKYLGSNGGPGNLTPNLDDLRKQSLYFSNFYATGTRTDRGLEAITLSMPPTPGRSIVKRVGRESGFASLGQQLRGLGYDPVFLYGGRGYFDNMNAFFSGNGYRIVDQSSVAEEEITFKNAWGMADEDLYSQALKVADASFSNQTPFLLQLMTTSNHRPYTYPDGRIDIPSGKGRDGAVKYTDYAIGKFLEEARKKPWFDSTLFIFVADHTAGSAGKEDLPVSNYHIPLFMYGPKLIKPGEYAGLASQIDIAPTVLGLLNASYTSTFFGRDMFAQANLAPRVLLGNYQHLGLFDGQDLAILSPRGELRRHIQALGESQEVTASVDDPLIARAIAYYQTASHDFKQQLLDWETPPDSEAAVLPANKQ
ncbi:LTA synthase family protein [Pseudomonas japonica]|uniref:LTA synthase family protein n=1 Tax=Pseudomonas japonica TaxID=256466 RepID=UPI0015E2BFBF|nr:LTA synthase family protein [Pseudomonas japonica]MBA1243752.1 sulfatase-like hydrolase/transferase [Pseudomonas japonica]